MAGKFRGLWSWHGEIGRGPYVLIGVLGFAIKHNLDRFMAAEIFHRYFDPFSYWIAPVRALRLTAISRPEAEFLLAMAGTALPFIWIGMALTVRRLHSIGLPPWLAVFFFAPVVNLVFFLILSLLPSRQPGAQPKATAVLHSTGFLGRLIPDSPWGSAALALLITVIAGVAADLLAVDVLKNYGWGLFVALPFCMGLLAVMIYGYHGPRTFISCIGVACASVLLLGGGIFLFAVEGAICLVMALPLALPLAALGGAMGCAIQRRPHSPQPAPTVLMGLLLFVPGMMAYEHAARLEPPIFAVRTAIEVNAPPGAVWKQVVAFAEIPPPTETIFRLGVAYPVRATITGSGPGAVRHCEFSTGAFTEPITVWNEPRLLRFSVTSSPEPLQEWTIYKHVHPTHLDGYLISRQGQFLLTALPGGGTRLEGTTWYQHHLWPADYWQIWSDAIIHRIHLRVLRHIKRLAEESSGSAARN